MLNSSVRRRLLFGTGASALSPVITIVVQVVSVPVFLHYWGAQLYGEWLILSAVPTYLGLSDIGFGTVAGNDMTMQVAASRRDGALEVFQSTWILSTAISIILSGAIAALVWFVPLNRWFHVTLLAPRQTALVMLLLSLYTLVGLQGAVFISGFKCEGNYALGQFLTSLTRIAEFAGAILAVIFGGSALSVAVAYLVVRIIGMLALGFALKRKSPWLEFGIGAASVGCMRRMAAPAIAFMAFPAGNALSLQGVLVVIGATMGPIAVVIFSTMRTLSRFPIQLVTVVALGIWPELSMAFGSENFPLARRLHRHACQACVWLSITAVLGLLMFGPWVYATWTHGKLVMDVSAFHLLLLVTCANAFWSTSSVVMLASNTHQRIAVYYLATTALSLPLAILLMPHFGLSGVAMALLASDLVMNWRVVPSSLIAVCDRPRDFVAGMFNLRPVIASAFAELGWGPRA